MKNPKKYEEHFRVSCVKSFKYDQTEFSGVESISTDHMLLQSMRGLGSFSTLITMEPLLMDLPLT